MMLKNNRKYYSEFPPFKYILESEKLYFRNRKKNNLGQRTNKWGFLLSAYEGMCPGTHMYSIWIRFLENVTCGEGDIRVQWHYLLISFVRNEMSFISGWVRELRAWFWAVLPMESLLASPSPVVSQLLRFSECWTP